MSKAKHTQGKWSVADYGHCIAVEVELDNGQEHTIMTDQFCHAARFNGDAMANARLIAEAPSMYEILKTINKGIHKMEFSQLEGLQNEIEELIKKIEG